MLHLKLFTTVPSFVYDFRICRNSSLFMSRKKSFLTPFCVTCPAIRHSYQQFKNCIVSSLLLLQTTTMMMRRITHSSSAAAAEESARPIFFFRRSRCRRRHCHRRAGRLWCRRHFARQRRCSASALTAVAQSTISVGKKNRRLFISRPT